MYFMIFRKSLVTIIIKSILFGFLLNIYGCVSSQNIVVDGNLYKSKSTSTPYKASYADKSKPILRIDNGGHQAIIRELLFTREGDLVSASDDKTIRVWNTQTGELKRMLSGQIGVGDKGKIYAAALSSDDKILAVGGDIGKRKKRQSYIRLIDFKTGEIATLLKGHSNVVLTLSFSPQGRHLLSGSADGTARIWDYRTGKTIHILRSSAKGISDFIYAAAFSPNGKNVVTGHSDGSLVLWDMASGSKIVKMSAHTDKVMSVSFSQDGKYILTGSLDRTIRMWKSNGEFIKILAEHNRAIDTLSVSKDNLVLAGFSSGTGIYG